MSQKAWRDGLKECETLASKSSKLELSQRYQEAFDAYLESAQKYLELLKIAPDDASKQKAKTGSAKVLARAEKIKSVLGDRVKATVRVKAEPTPGECIESTMGVLI